MSALLLKVSCPASQDLSSHLQSFFARRDKCLHFSAPLCSQGCAEGGGAASASSAASASTTADVLGGQSSGNPPPTRAAALARSRVRDRDRSIAIVTPLRRRSLACARASARALAAPSFRHCSQRPPPTRAPTTLPIARADDRSDRARPPAPPARAARSRRSLAPPARDVGAPPHLHTITSRHPLAPPARAARLLRRPRTALRRFGDARGIGTSSSQWRMQRATKILLDSVGYFTILLTGISGIFVNNLHYCGRGRFC